MYIDSAAQERPGSTQPAVTPTDPGPAIGGNAAPSAGAPAPAGNGTDPTDGPSDVVPGGGGPYSGPPTDSVTVGSTIGNQPGVVTLPHPIDNTGAAPPSGTGGLDSTNNSTAGDSSGATIKKLQIDLKRAPVLRRQVRRELLQLRISLRRQIKQQFGAALGDNKELQGQVRSLFREFNGDVQKALTQVTAPTVGGSIDGAAVLNGLDNAYSSLIARLQSIFGSQAGASSQSTGADRTPTTGNGSLLTSANKFAGDVGTASPSAGARAIQPRVTALPDSGIKIDHAALDQIFNGERARLEGYLAAQTQEALRLSRGAHGAVGSSLDIRV